MVNEEQLKELGEIAAGVFASGRRSIAQMCAEDTPQREFEVLSIDLAARLSYLAQLVSQLADDVGTADYEKRYKPSPPLVTEAGKIYLSWRGI